MGKKKKSSNKEEIFVINPEQLRDDFEGVWQAMVPPSFDIVEELEVDESELYLIQDSDDPSRFTGVYKGDFIDGELDLRVLPPMSKEDESPIFYTFTEGDEFEMMMGGGLIFHPEEDILVGLKFIHMGETVPTYWKRVSREIPEELREEFEAEEFGELEGEILESLFATLPGPDAFKAPETLEELLASSPGILKVLQDGGISTLNELYEASEENLLAIKGIGPSRLEEIKSRMQSIQLIDELLGIEEEI